jgi:hypothetical protein
MSPFSFWAPEQRLSTPTFGSISNITNDSTLNKRTKHINFKVSIWHLTIDWSGFANVEVEHEFRHKILYKTVWMNELSDDIKCWSLCISANFASFWRSFTLPGPYIPVKAAGPLAQSCLSGLSCSDKEYEYACIRSQRSNHVPILNFWPKL